MTTYGQPSTESHEGILVEFSLFENCFRFLNSSFFLIDKLEYSCYIGLVNSKKTDRGVQSRLRNIPSSKNATIQGAPVELVSAWRSCCPNGERNANNIDLCRLEQLPKLRSSNDRWLWHKDTCWHRERCRECHHLKLWSAIMMLLHARSLI